jgi:glutamyl-tRNA reductase
MSILIVSVSHKTTSVDVLSQLAMDPGTAGKLGDALIASDHIDEAVVLSTCNRTEIYASVSRFHGGLDDATSLVAQLAGISVDELRKICAVYFDEGAVAHMFTVASGLDSMVLGENQILGQVKQALSASQAAGTVGTVLNALFQQALRVGKRVQSETEIGHAGRSLVSAAYALLTAEIGELAGRRVLVVGAGAMAGLAARTAAAAGADVSCLNRTYVKAERLAASIGGRAVPFVALAEAVSETEILITCTGARDLYLDADYLRGSRVQGVVDLALPADVSEEVVDLGIALINLNRLVVEQLDAAGQPEIIAARDLVASEVQDFLGVRRAAHVAPTVIALRSMASEVVAAELTRLDARLPEMDARERGEVQQTVRRVVEKLLHQPTVRVQELATGPEAVDYAAALRELFALDPQAVAAVMSPEVGR